MTKNLGYTKQEIGTLRRLNTPVKIQDYLETLRTNFEEYGETCMSPRKVLRTRQAHCIEGAMLAAAALEFHGHKPFVMDLRSTSGDFDHVVALFREGGCWGAISKSNHAVLRYREPVYRTLRELALSYFHEYFDDNGRKNLRFYSVAVDLNRFNRFAWRTSEEDLWDVGYGIDKAKHFSILSRQQVKSLRRADPLEIAAGKLVQWKEKRR